MKTCKNCGETKPETAEFFQRKKDKFVAFCKPCQSVIDFRKRLIKAGAVFLGPDYDPKQLPSTCRSCGETKPASEFYSHIRTTCKACHSQQTAKANAQRRRERSPEDFMFGPPKPLNSEHQKTPPHVPTPRWKPAFMPKGHRACGSCQKTYPLTEAHWYDCDRKPSCKMCANRRSRNYNKKSRQKPEVKKRRTAVQRERQARQRHGEQLLTEAERAEVWAIYENRPDGYHVDHIIPLAAPDMCNAIKGMLHAPWNLQYLPAAENLSKGNRL